LQFGGQHRIRSRFHRQVKRGGGDSERRGYLALKKEKLNPLIVFRNGPIKEWREEALLHGCVGNVKKEWDGTRARPKVPSSWRRGKRSKGDYVKEGGGKDANTAPVGMVQKKGGILRNLQTEGDGFGGESRRQGGRQHRQRWQRRAGYKGIWRAKGGKKSIEVPGVTGRQEKSSRSLSEPRNRREKERGDLVRTMRPNGNSGTS